MDIDFDQFESGTGQIARYGGRYRSFAVTHTVVRRRFLVQLIHPWAAASFLRAAVHTKMPRHRALFRNSARKVLVEREGDVKMHSNRAHASLMKPRTPRLLAN